MLTLDFSLYTDMPAPMQAWNLYRSRALALFWRREGLKVVPMFSWVQSETYGPAFGGLPKRSTVAVSTVGVKGDEQARAVRADGMAVAMRALEPRRVLLYGKTSEYGSEYRSLLTDGDIKFVVRRDNKATKAPQESMTPNRVYATVDKRSGELHSIAYMDGEGKRFKQIDFEPHGELQIHAYDVYNHNGKARPLDAEEMSMAERVQMAYGRFRRSGGKP